MYLILYGENCSLAKKIQEQLINIEGIEVEIIHIDKITGNDFYVADYVYSEWGLEEILINSYWEFIKEKPFGFYNEEFISDIDDCKNMMEILQEAIESKNWKLCKSINSFLKYGDLIRKRTKMRCYPSKIQIESTDLCNARCIMCSHAYSDGSGIDLFETDILDKLKCLYPYLKEIVLHGNGEPFLKTEMISYLKVLSDYDIKFIANTNLSIVTDEIIELLKNNFIELNVSCDAHTKELYETIRNGLSFDVFVENALKVRKKCPQLCMKLNTVVMRQNIPYLKEIVLFASEIGFDEVVFNMLCVDKNNNNLQDSPLFFIKEYSSSIKRAKKIANDKGIKVTSFCLDGDIEDKFEDIKRHTTGICDWLVEGAYIDLHGQVGLCCINQNVKMGSINYSGFENIWNCKKYQDIRSMFYKDEIPQFCFGCDFILQHRLNYIVSYGNEGYFLNKQERDINRNE